MQKKKNRTEGTKKGKFISFQNLPVLETGILWLAKKMFFK